MFQTKINTILDQCPIRMHTGNFKATIGCELCVDLHGSGTMNTNSSLDIAVCWRPRNLGSCHQRLELHHRSWCSNAGWVTKVIGYICFKCPSKDPTELLVSKRAKFFAFDCRHDDAFLKLHVMSNTKDETLLCFIKRFWKILHVLEGMHWWVKSAQLWDHSNVSGLQPAYCIVKKLLSKPASWMSDIGTADGFAVSAKDAQRTLAEYFQPVHIVDSQNGQL